jgi:uncharacterized protein YndB with AHSA1/START domain
MTGHSAIHDIFTIERTYDTAPAGVFAAFSTEQARNSWGDTSDPQPPTGEGVNEDTTL